MPLLALDDTDTPRSGCTTHTAYQIAQAVEQADGPLRDWGLTRPARLVRLNPAAPHRTRGNGALVIPLGPKPPGGQRVGTWSNGRPIEIPTGPLAEAWPDPAQRAQLHRIVDRLLPAPAEDEADPQPGALLLARPSDPQLYRLAVSRMVSPEQAWSHAPEGTLRLTCGRRRGETGALAASAWPTDPVLAGPEARWSWEYVSYRDPREGERSKEIPTDFTKTLEHLAGGFDNLDPVEGRVRSVPRTPCPVLFGIRGRDPQALVHTFTRPPYQERPGWLLLTNHATGDHARYAPSSLWTYQVVRASVTVTGRPERRRGGHLFVPGELEGHPVVLAAFEPTKDLRAPLGATRAGDRLLVLARTRDDPHLLALEAFRVERLAPRTRPAGNPRCPRCQGSTKSRGKGAGYRCPRCRVHLEEEARRSRRLDAGPLRTGARFQVPDHVRGHMLPPWQGLGPILDLDEGDPLTIDPVLEAQETAAAAPPVLPASR